MKIAIEHISKTYYGQAVLKDITLKLLDHEMIMLLGLNGAGKTTLLKILAGLIPPDGGRILFSGRDLHAMPQKQRASLFSYIPQKGGAIPQMSVRNFILLGVNPYLGFFEVPGMEYEAALLEAMERFSISHFADRPLYQLSGGERRLVYLARAMLQKSKVMLLDEPTASLDYRRQHLFLGELKRWISEMGRGAILSIHDPNLALQYADKIVVLHENRVFARFRRSQTGFETAFMEALNEIYEGRLALLEKDGKKAVIWKGE